MDKFEKMKKYLIGDLTVMLILSVYFVIDSLLEFVSLKTGLTGLLSAILYTVLFVFGIIYTKKSSKTGAIFAIVAGSLMVLSGALSSAIIAMLLGIIIIVHSIIYLVNFDKK